MNKDIPPGNVFLTIYNTLKKKKPGFTSNSNDNIKSPCSTCIIQGSAPKSAVTLKCESSSKLPQIWVRYPVRAPKLIFMAYPMWKYFSKSKYLIVMVERISPGSKNLIFVRSLDSLSAGLLQLCVNSQLLGIFSKQTWLKVLLSSYFIVKKLEIMDIFYQIW